MTAPVPDQQATQALTAVRHTERRVQLALWASGESVWEWDAASKRIAVDQSEADAGTAGPGIEKLLPGATVGMPLEQFFSQVHVEDAPALRLAWALHLRGAHADIDRAFRVTDPAGRQRRQLLGCLHPLGHRVHAQHLTQPHDAVEQPHRRQVALDVHHKAAVDQDLVKRLAAQVHIDQLLVHAAPEFGLLFIDLDGFKEVNDSFGHDSGDALLCAVGQRLRAALPPDALLVRWGSDEYLVVLAQGSGDTELRSAAQVVLAALAGRFDVGDQELSITPTVGAVLAPQDGLDFSVLLRKADAANYAGKQAGRNCLVFFDNSLDNDAQRRVRMTSLLRIDTDRNGFRFVAQPEVDSLGRPVGAELLMRWNTEAFGNVSPIKFIPLAEKVGLIQLMGRHAAHAVAPLAAAGAALGYPLPVAVNLSPKQLLQPGLDSLLLQACRRHSIPPSMLELELTESALVHNMDVVKPMLHRLRGHGFSLALDDFGTGYSSLSYLRHLPFDKILIDRSFVMDIERAPAAVRLLDSIVRLCQLLGMHTVAEGVETPQQLAALAAMGVNEFQGYHFSRPIPMEDWLDLLRHAKGALPLLPLPVPPLMPVGAALLLPQTTSPVSPMPQPPSPGLAATVLS